MKKLLLISLLSCHCYAGDLIYNNGFEISSTVSGSTTGLSSSGLQLNLASGNISENLDIQTNGVFSFSSVVPVGATWIVSINSQPTIPDTQNCSLTNNSGIITSDDINNLEVLCTDSALYNWDEMNWNEGQWQ